jgi:hypothetical protein
LRQERTQLVQTAMSQFDPKRTSKADSDVAFADFIAFLAGSVSTKHLRGALGNKSFFRTTVSISVPGSSTAKRLESYLFVKRITARRHQYR